MIDVSVDDRRALWALTTRHLRTPTYGAVLLVRAALRAQAAHIDVRTRGGAVIVDDDGADRVAEARALAAVLRDPHIGALHELEQRYGTDLLVASATAARAVIDVDGLRVDVRGGAVASVARGPARRGARVVLERPASRRSEERLELRAWLPAPRARVRVDGWRLDGVVRLPAGAFFGRSFVHKAGGDDIRGAVGFVLGESTSRTTVLMRGVWVAEDAVRASSLPVVAVYDDDHIGDPDHVIARARVTVERAAQQLQHELAARLPRLTRREQRALRALLLRAPALPPSFAHTPLFDDEQGELRLSLAALQQRDSIVIGTANADVVVDDIAAAFLRRALPGRVKDALPPPRRRFFAPR
jgi:hypothetical protein